MGPSVFVWGVLVEAFKVCTTNLDLICDVLTKQGQGFLMRKTEEYYGDDFKVVRSRYVKYDIDYHREFALVIRRLNPLINEYSLYGDGHLCTASGISYRQLLFQATVAYTITFRIPSNLR
jgi:hypothetical protein